MSERRGALLSAVAWPAAALILGVAPLRAVGPTARPPVIDLASPKPNPRPGARSAPATDRRRAAAEATAGQVPREGVTVAQVSFVESRVDVQRPGAAWERLPEGGRVRTGDRLRTAADSSARLQFPWMSVSLAPSSVLGLAPGAILGLQLESGRVELASGRDDIVKLDTPDVRVRGQGWVIVRRGPSGTQVSVLRGEFNVGGTTLAEANGCVVARVRAACRPSPLPEAPRALVPGSDPRYVRQSERLTLAWDTSALAQGYVVQVLSFEDDAVLLQQEVATPTHEVRVPWLGLYRWRVSARDAGGLEGAPSLEGLFCVMPGRWLEDSAPRGPVAPSSGRRQRERTPNERGTLEKPSSPEAATASTRQ
jgi:hypothetical protein